MNEREKLKHCLGCTENFYNGNNPLGVQRCWHLDSAKLVNKVRVPIDMRPPWPRRVVKVFQCRREHRVVLMTPENFDANMREYERCVAREKRTEQAKP